MKFILPIFVISVLVACNNNESTNDVVTNNNITNEQSNPVTEKTADTVNYDTINISKLTALRADTFFIGLMNHYLVKRDSDKIEKLYQHVRNNNIQIPEIYVAYASFINENRTRNDEAIAIYKEAIAMKPDYHLPYKIIGNIYIHYNMMQDALNYLTKAHELEPKDVEVVNNIANIYFVDKQYDIAISYYSKAIDIQPNEVVYSNRAVCYEQLGQMQQANQDRIAAASYSQN